MNDTAPAEGGDLFTRGGPNMPDTRGKSMVAVHLDKLQKEKEERGMEKLRLLMPQLSTATHAVALQECNWEEDKAVAMLRLFVAKKADELKKLAKEKKKHHKKLLERMNKAQRSDENSGSESSGTSGSDSGSGSETEVSGSDEEEDDRHRHRSRDNKRKEKESSSRKRSRSSKSHRDDRSSKKKRSRKEKDSKKRSSSSRRREKEKDRKKEKKEKREKKSSRRDVRDDNKRSTKEYEYGAFGVIRETDYYTKRAEFMLWALEVKNSDVEAMSRFEEKELFKSYMEDYNTATLPHKKFYNLESYENEVAARGGGGGDSGGGEKMVFDDEAERKKELVAERQREHAERLRAAYEDLQTTDKAQAMREQELMRAKMALAYRTGDQKEAARLAERLKPDEPK